MRPRDAWRAALPARENSEVVGFMVEIFRSLADRKLPAFRFGLKEPDITSTLGSRLDALGKKHGFTGLWTYEGQISVVDEETLVRSQCRRTDIRYFSNDPKAPLDLTFEFKKMDTGSYCRSHYTGDKGMARFVYDRYGTNSLVGYMASIMEYDDPAVVNSLILAIRNKDLGVKLKIDGVPSATRKPSAICPEHAVFDTHHARQKGTSVHMTVSLAHMKLAFELGPAPSPPASEKKQGRQRKLSIAALRP